MLFYNNSLCISYKELMNGGIMNKPLFDAYKLRGKLQLLCKGGNGREALIAYDTMPEQLKEKVRKVYGDNVRELAMQNPIKKWLQRDVKASDFYSTYRLPNNLFLKAEKQQEYTANASVLNAIINLLNDKKSYRKALGGTSTGQAYKSIVEAVKAISGEWGCKLPSSERGLRRVVEAYKKEGYESLISGKLANDNAAKIVEDDQHALLRKLLSHANNFDYSQVQMMYNQIADANGWRKITRKTVENFANKNKFYTEAGRRGDSNWNNTISMQNKRRAAAYPMLYWTIDGWDAELLYQRSETTAKGGNITTYSNRPTVVVILDPFNKYPVGYAIGTHETPELIRQALRNALNHTAELFGCRYRPQQLQTDNYGNGNLTPYYEAISPKYTPAEAKNAKAKVIEPWFNKFNRTHCQFANNWSGFGVTAKKDNQPNTDWKNKLRHSFPDFDGVVAQLSEMIEKERAKLKEFYIEGFKALPDTYHLPWTTEQFLYHAGERKERTTKLRGEGIAFQLSNADYTYDSFDIEFRMHQNTDWVIKYDPSNMENVLATTNDGTVRFLLEEKHIQPMSLAERTDGDGEALARVRQLNKELKERNMEQSWQDYKLVQGLVEGKEDTLAKMLLVDSLGQHKDRKNANRAVESGKKMIANSEKQDAVQQRKVIAQEKSEKEAAYDEYINSKVNINEYL